MIVTMCEVEVVVQLVGDVVVILCNKRYGKTRMKSSSVGDTGDR